MFCPKIFNKFGRADKLLQRILYERCIGKTKTRIQLHNLVTPKVPRQVHGISHNTKLKGAIREIHGNNSASVLKVSEIINGGLCLAQRHFHCCQRPSYKPLSNIVIIKRFYAIQKVEDNLLLKYLETLDYEYHQMNQSHRKEEGDQKSRRLFLMPIVEMYENLKENIKTVEELKQLAQDEEMKSLAEAEIPTVLEQIDALKQQILDGLVPDIKYDKNDAIMELTPGIGGEEAKLFNLDIFNMYERFASFKGWTFSPTAYVKSDSGGLIKATVEITGYDVFKQLKYETGTHRVQRVPKTEKGGRIHTSTSSVAILPKPSEIDIKINPNEIKIDLCRASGPGGQSVNKTESSVRITHLPTGIMTVCQEERSQSRNKIIAMEKIRNMLYEKEFTAQMNSIKTQRKLQVGSASRSDKIRTYNFGQNRVTDHRIHHSIHDIAGFLSGGELLDSLIEKLLEESRQEILIEMLEEFKSKHL